MSLQRTEIELGWPPKEQILQPQGAGAAVNATLAREKVGRSLGSLEGAADAQIGILSLDPSTNETQAPLALVCNFLRPVPVQTLAELQRLAWNFSRTPLLLTVEPHRLRAFTCYKRPSQVVHLLTRSEVNNDTLPSEIDKAHYNFTDRATQTDHLTNQATHALHWLELASGRFLQRYKQYFPHEERADSLLLDNLQIVRSRLHGQKLEDDIIHDLLARVIFIQFLFHRRDANGHTALDPLYLRRLHKRGVLAAPYQSLGEILTHHADSYQLFRYLNDRFNGDLFPGKGSDPEESEREWHVEMKAVHPEHLLLLSDFVEGRLQMRSGQLSLWPHYSFDVIPLEFLHRTYFFY